MKHRNAPPTLKLLAIALAGLVLALPLFALDCEMACARGAASRAAMSESPVPAGHCASHGAASPTRSSGAPATPDGCGHHGDSAALKKGIEGAEKSSKLSTVAAPAPTAVGSAFYRISSSVEFTAFSITPERSPALLRILRL